MVEFVLREKGFESSDVRLEVTEIVQNHRFYLVKLLENSLLSSKSWEKLINLRAERFRVKISSQFKDLGVLFQIKKNLKKNFFILKMFVRNYNL